MKKNIHLGSMLSPFCFYKTDATCWLMICGLQFIFYYKIPNYKEKEKFHINFISFYQWTTRIRWFFFGKSEKEKIK